MLVKQIYLDLATATEIWSGDVAIAGATCAALELAVKLARSGMRVCLLESGTSLGSEITAAWESKWPGGVLETAIRSTCDEYNIPNGPRPDLVGATFAFDELTRKEGVSAFVRMVPTEIAFSASGKLMGLVIAGKSGRQIASAPIVIDVTEDCKLSRRTFRLPQRQPVSARLTAHLANCGDACEKSFEFDGASFFFNPLSWKGEATLTAELKLSSKMEHNACFRLLYEKIISAWKAQKEKGGLLDGAVLMGVASRMSFQYPVAPLPDSTMSRHGVWALNGERDVDEIFEEVMAISQAGTVPFVSEPLADEALECSELQADPDQDLMEIAVPEPIATLEEATEVLVAGNGCSGAFAALAAAQEGCDVLVIDPLEIPGGVATGGRIHSYCCGLDGGIQDEINASSLEKACGMKYSGNFHPEMRARDLMQRMLDTDKIIFRTGQTAFAVVKDENRVGAVVTADIDGYHIYPCQVVIDATGDADIAAAAGAKTIIGREGDGFPQAYSFTPAMFRDNTVTFSNFDVGCTDPTDSIEYSRAHFRGRKISMENEPFSPAVHFSFFAHLLGLREGRCIVAREHLSLEDFFDGKVWDDAVCSSMAFHDNHAMDYDNESEFSQRLVIKCGLWNYKVSGQIPYGALQPEDIEGIIVTGRCIGVDHDLAQLIRMQKDMQVLGEVSGVAAALSIKDGVLVGDVDVKRLKHRLEERGIKAQPPNKVGDKPLQSLLDDLLLDIDAPTKNDVLARNAAIWRLGTLEEGAGSFWESYFDSMPEKAAFPAAMAAALGGHALPQVQQILENIALSRLDGPMYAVRLGTKAPAPFLQAALALADVGAQSALKILKGILDEFSATHSIENPHVFLVIDALKKCNAPVEATRIIREFMQNTRNEAFLQRLWGGKSDNPPVSFRYKFELKCADVLVELGVASDDEIYAILKPYINSDELLVRKYARNIWKLLS